MEKITLTKVFDLDELNGSVNITYSFDEDTDIYRPCGIGTPEVEDVATTNFCIESVEIDIMGVGFLITENIEKKLGKLKYNKLIDALENASE